MSKRYSEFIQQDLLIGIFDSTEIDLSILGDSSMMTDLSPGQKRIWMDDIKQGIQRPVRAVYMLNGIIDADLFEEAFRSVLRRHEFLMMRIGEKNDIPYRQIVDEPAFTVIKSDYTAVGHGGSLMPLKGILDEDRHFMHSVNGKPLLRCTMHDMGGNTSYLSLAAHSILTDGHTLSLVCLEMMYIYEELKQGRRINPELPLSSQAPGSQDNRYVNEELQEQMLFWQNELSGFQKTIDMPVDYTGKYSNELSNNDSRKIISRELTSELCSLSNKLEIDLEAVLHAAFAVIISRYTDATDQIICIPCSVRDAPFSRGLPDRVNDVMVKTATPFDITFAVAAGIVNNARIRARVAGSIPIDLVLAGIGYRGEFNKAPGCQYYFELIPCAPSESIITGVRVTEVDYFDILRKPEYKYRLIARHSEDGIHLCYRHGDGMSLYIAEDLLDQYILLLELIARDASLPLSSYTLRTERGWKGLPDPRVKIPRHEVEGPHVSFSRNAQSNPERIAITDIFDSWSYGDLDRLSNRLANALIDRGVGKNSVIAIYAHRSGALVMAILGILKAGAAFVILDPSYPVARIMEYLRTAKPVGFLQIVAAGPLPREIGEYVRGEPLKVFLEIPTLSMRGAFLNDFTESSPARDHDADDVAYLAFTSGTTGAPKGIIGTLPPVAHFISWHIREFAFCSEDRFSMLSGLAHDPLLRDIFTPLCAGARLCIPNQDIFIEPGQLFDWMAREAVTVCHLTPPLARLICETSGMGDVVANPNSLALRYAFFGGDRLRFGDIEKMKRIAKSIQCVNFYGTTETPQAMTYELVNDEFLHDERLRSILRESVVPVGKGIDGVQVLLFDRSMKPAGPGEIAEVYIQTPYLTRGYLDDDSMTWEKYPINPYSDVGERLYRTGDIGRYLPGARVEFLGRRDHQIKIRGYRVEISEIETAVRRCPGVLDAAVTMKGNGSDEYQVVAYVVVDKRNNGTDNIASIRNHVACEVPDYMVPALIIPVEIIPLTPNGKTDWSKLAESKARVAAAYRKKKPSSSDLETKILGVWEEVFGIDNIGVDDNFFDLGGNSISATRLIGLLGKKLNMMVPMQYLFLEPNIEGLARLIEKDRSTSKASGSVKASGLISLFPVQSRGTRRPMFIVAGAHSIRNPHQIIKLKNRYEEDFLRYMSNLVSHLGSDQPLYGFRPRGWDGIANPHGSVEEMAADYIAELKILQPRGPYLIAGECVGAIIAFEMARQLENNGDEVGLLMMMDADNPTLRFQLKENLLISYRQYKKLVIYYLALGPLGAVRAGLKHLAIIFSDMLPVDDGYRIINRIRKMDKRYQRILFRYRAKPYRGRVVHILCEDMYDRDQDRGWSSVLSDNLTVIKVPGDHLTRLTTYGKITGEYMKNSIEKAFTVSRPQ